jgi:hypothetical protein
VAWETICKAIEEGGLDVKNMKLFNEALLGKWVWRIKNERNSLWRKVLVSKYGEEGLFLSDRVVKGSHWWQDLNKLFGVWEGDCEWLHKNIVKNIGDGQDTSFGMIIGWGLELYV